MIADLIRQMDRGGLPEDIGHSRRDRGSEGADVPAGEVARGAADQGGAKLPYLLPAVLVTCARWVKCMHMQRTRFDIQSKSLACIAIRISM